MKLHMKDLVLLMGHAKNALLAQPHQCRLPNMIRDLSDGEKLALAYFDAALNVLGGQGIDTSHVIIEYQTVDSETI